MRVGRLLRPVFAAGTAIVLTAALAAGELIVPGEGPGGIVGAVWQR